jgi:hypothetical protein
MSLETIGRLHPLLVHLPIGILALALVSEAYRPRTEDEAGTSTSVRRLLWLLGTGSAAASCMTGLLLANEGGHVSDLTDRHKWSAIATTLLASFGYASTFAHGGSRTHRLLRRSAQIGVLSGLLLTGHFGGSITHGEGYLTTILPKPTRSGQPGESIPEGSSGNPGKSTRNQSGTDPSKTLEEWAPEDVQEADTAVLARLRGTGMVVLPVEPGNGRLQATLMNLSVPADSAVRMLAAVSSQLVWLKADVKDLTDKGCVALAELTRLTRLSMAGSAVTDTGLTHLAGLVKLRRLNLTGTAVTEQGLESLGPKPAMTELFLFGTKVRRASLEGFDSLFPSAVIDTGGYRLPGTAGDATGKDTPDTP